MICKNTKAMVRSVDGDTDFFEIVADARRYIFATYIYNLFRLGTSNINSSNKRKWFHSKKKQEVEDIPQKL